MEGEQPVSPSRTSRVLLVLALVVALAVVGVVVAATAGARGLAALRLPAQYAWPVLVEEADTMSNCAECHESEHFHTCSTCHDDHGAVEMSGIPFYAVVALTGDVPKPGYVFINDVLPYQDQPHTHVPLLDVLAERGVIDFESVTLASRDEGFVTIERANLTPEALLMPYQDGIRFAAENLHVSTWLKGITRIIVVGAERPLRVDGQATSMGRLLLGPTRSVTVEQTDVMLKSETDGQVRKGKTATRIEGAPIDEIVANPAFDRLLVRDGDGQEHTLTADEAQRAVLCLVRGQVTLVLPDRGRVQWITDVVEIISER
jgi:hypothetical protein